MITDLRTIARALGGDVVGHEVRAPGPGHSPKDRSLAVMPSVTAPEGFIVFSHAGDDFRVCRDYVKAKLGITNDNCRWADRQRVTPARAMREDNKRILDCVQWIVSSLRPVRGTPGEVYLRDTRRIGAEAIGDVLERTDAIGWHPSVLFREDGHALNGQRIGAIIAVQTDPVTAKPTGGISRTYVHEGRKITKAKGLGPAGAVRLSRDEDVLDGLHVAEGLETALAAMSIGLRPCWSTGSTAIMAKLPAIAGIESICVLADNDPNGAGERAARELGSRWLAAGREARIWAPKTKGDLNDILMGART